MRYTQRQDIHDLISQIHARVATADADIFIKLFRMKLEETKNKFLRVSPEELVLLQCEAQVYDRLIRDILNPNIPGKEQA